MIFRAFVPSFALLAALVLGGCGFQLRQEAELPPELSVLRIETVDPYSDLARDLGLALERAGADISEVEEAAVLRILDDRIVSAPLTVGETGRVQEYELRYAVQFELLDPNGEPRMPRQTVELTRDYTYDTADETGRALGAPAEQELVARELRREMVQAILRRIEAASR